jgi:hypothetical protein
MLIGPDGKPVGVAGESLVDSVSDVIKKPIKQLYWLLRSN